MQNSAGRPKIAIAHRGASAYAPEHTIPAYEMAILQGADFIEPDLQITQDGILISLHDLTLERTTNVEALFPDRYREDPTEGTGVRRWYASDFTLEEIRSLDAGSWFHGEFAGAKVPTLDEVIEVAAGKVGIYPETKAPEVYGALGFEMETQLLNTLERHSVTRGRTGSGTPVVIQSFSAESLHILRGLGSELPLVLLVDRMPPSSSEPSRVGPPDRLSVQGLGRVSEFADGIGPAKELLLENPDVVPRAHEAGLDVVPWTFRADDPGRFGNVGEEMAYFLYELGVDALFTNNPDLFPR
jgi:glycerophosphoryl diester phosphodiesterase